MVTKIFLGLSIALFAFSAQAAPTICSAFLEKSIDPYAPPRKDRSRYGNIYNDTQGFIDLEISLGSQIKEKIKIHPAKRTEFINLNEALMNAASYKEGIQILRREMIAANIIQYYDRLAVTHSSSQPPRVILSSGLRSLKGRKELYGDQAGSHWGQGTGDGVYAEGSERGGWHPGDWGKYKYLIEYYAVWLAHNNNLHANSFITFYMMLRQKWGKDLSGGYDGEFASGNPSEMMCATCWIYEEMDLLGASFALEVLIKRTKIPPQRIKAIDPRR